MIYHRLIQIEFNHCDPAGIVFYPRYFEMTNSVTENFFAEVAGQPYAAMMQDRQGVPTAHIDANFHVPSRLGEKLDFRLSIIRLGRTSVTFHIEGHCDGTHRLTVDITLVWVSPDGRPTPWAPATLARMTAFQEAT